MYGVLEQISIFHFPKPLLFWLLKPTHKHKYIFIHIQQNTTLLFSMAIAFKSPTTSFFQLKKNNPETHSFLRFSSQRFATPARRFTPMAAISTVPTVGLSETFTRLKKQGKVSIFSLCSHFLFSLLCFNYILPKKSWVLLCFNWSVGMCFIIYIFFPGLCLGCFLSF